MTAKPGSYGIEDLMSVPQLRPGYWKTLGGLSHDRIGIEVARTNTSTLAWRNSSSRGNTPCN